MKDKAIGVVLAIVGILLFSTKAVIVKLAYEYQIDTVSLLLLRMLFSLPFYLVIAALYKPKERINGKNWVSIILLGMTGYYLASYFDFLGLQYIKASLERLILFIYPTLVILISFFFLRKKIKPIQVLGILITYLGIGLIFVSEIAVSSDYQIIKGGILIFLCAIAYASYLVGSGEVIQKLGATVFTSYAMIVACISIFIHYGLTTEFNLFDFEGEVYFLSFTMAIVATVIPSYLISYSIKKMGASNFSIFAGLGPVSTIFLAYLFLDEQLSLWQWLGSGVVIGGILVAERKKK